MPALSAELWDNLLISVTATDSGNNSFTQSFNLTHISVDLDSYSFQENVTDAVVAHITQSVKSEEYLSGWTTSLSGSDARFFKINSDNDIQYIGTADYESKSSYDIVIVFTHSSGLSYESMHTIDVLDRNDSPLLWYSHANNLNIYSSDSWMESRYLFGVKEEVTNPYIMTLEFGDQDLNDTHSIQITYKEYLGYYYDENGNPVFSYGDAINITDLFTFDAETGALYFNGQVDFESISGDLSGLNSTHDWHDPITISITDSSGASDTMTVLMQAFDSSSDGSIDVSYTGAYTNFSNELSWPLWRGPKDWDTNKSPELIDLVSGDINGDGLQDYIAFYTNSDYIYPYTYSSLVVSLGGPTLFPYYQPDVYTWSGDQSWNSILGNGLGSVIVQLPARFLSDYGDIRYSSFWGLQTGDFNGDGKDDILLELDDYIIVGYGQNFDSSSAQNSNIMDLSDIASDQSNGFILNLSDYSDSYINMKGVGDFDGDGKVDIVLWDYDNSLIILNGDSTSEFLLTKTTLNGDSLQANMGFGSDIAIGDFNGDGKIDLAVAAPLYDKIPGTNSNEGAIYIYLNLLNFAGSSPDVVIEGGNAGDEIGYWGILNLGDINGDGIDDLGFGDVDDISYILWGSSILSPSYNLGNELFVETPTSTSFTGIDSGVAGFDITNVTAVGDINGDGYDDLAASAYDKVLILYGQSSWETIYLTSEGLNFLSILQDNAYPDIYALGDLDDDGKDEFGFTYASSNAYTDDDVLRIWNGSDPSLDLNGFSLQLKNATFSVDENLLGADIGTLETSTDHNLSNFSLYIVATYDDNWDVIDSNLFEIGSDGTIRLKAGISLDAETSSTYNLRIYIVDQVKDQINQQYITVNVNNINEAPSFALSNRVVDGNAAAGTVIGVLSSTDLDGDDVTFTLSGSDAGMFVIDPATSEIRFADGVTVDTNSQVSFNVTITALDSFGLESSEDISIEVNLAPTDITLDTNLVQESVRGAAIGQLHVTDENISDEFTYTISGEDAWMFNITSEGVLELSGNVFADFESMESINITIHATDLLGKSISKDFTIYTKDINYSNPSISDTIFSNFVIPLSGNPIIDSLLFGFTLDPDHDSSTPLSITYSIIGLDSTFDYDGYDGAVAARVEATDSFVSAIDEIFEYLGNLLGISFIKVEETADVVGDIRCGLTNLPDAGWLGVCEITGDYLGNLDNSLFETSSRDSDIWINMAFNSMDENNVTPGTTIYETIIHELGHSLGLKHPQQTFQYTELEWYENQGYTTESIYNYFLETFGYDLQYDDVDHLFTSIHQTLPRLFNGLDSNAYSIMSYDEYAGDDWSESKNSGVSGVVACGICGHSHGGDSHNTAAPKIIDINSGIQVAPSTFMSFDIFALMYIYNYDESSEAWSIPNFNEGDTTYVIDGPVFMSIHDTGGNDTIDLSAFNFDITFNMSFMGYTVDPNTGEYEFSYQYNEIGTNLLSYKDGQNYSGYIINVSPFTEIENLVLGGGNDTVYADFMGYNTANEIHAGTGNDLVYQVAVNDTIYAEEGNDFISALSTDFNLVDGGEGYDILTISQKLLDSGLYSVDLRDLTQGQIHGIEEFAYYENLLGQGQILISLQTFKSMSQSTLTIKHTWLSGNVQAVGLEGDFVLSGSTDAYDIYSISDAGQNYSLFVWKDHYVYQIDDSPIDLNLSNSFVFDGIWTVVGGLSISGESWINPDKTWHNSNPTPMYSLSGEDAEYFEIRNGELHLISKPDYELKQSYTITISVVSFSGKTESKDFIIEVKDWDEAIETSGNDVIAGTDGSDFLYGGSGDDEISGGKGNDYIFGSIGSDLLRGDEGDDRILGEGNNDEIYGGDGNDTIFGDSGDDSLFGDAGNDLIYGNDGNDTAEGGSGDDVILGLNGDDNLYGDSETGENNTDGNDTLYGGQGNDSIWGRGGNDIIYGSTGNDKLNGGSGDDIIRGGNDDDILVGQFGNDTLSGDSGNDILYGDRETGESSDDGNDILWGGFGNDELYGRGGDDYLVGQNGLDVLTGGEGADTFVLTSYSSSDSRDTIKDYVDGTDKIGLIGIDFDSLTISQDVNAVDTNIFDAGGNIIAVLEGVAATDIDAADFVSLDFDLLQILEVRPTMVNFDLIALGLELEAPSASNTDASDIGGASSIAPDKDNIVQPISNGGSSFNAMISGDLLDSLIDHQEDLNLTFNDFI